VLRRFLHNTAISAVAYGLAGVLGLFAVGLIARSYGLTVLGLIVLVRAFLPTGLLSLIDLGASEIATQAVARGRVGDWSAASEKVSLLATITGALGIASAVALWLGGPLIAAIFKVAPGELAKFVAILQLTAVLLPIAFLGLVVEGVFKGFERYGWLRATEVGSNATYVLAVYGSVWQGAAFEWIAYWYLAALVAKYLVLIVVLRLVTRDTQLRFAMWSTESRKDVLHRCLLMFNGRIGGVLQQTVIPIAIGALYSPTEVGAYDLIMRLPRFMKTTMAPLYSAILPISTYIDETTDTRRMQMLGRNGFVLPGAIVVPVLAVMALFSQDILRIWVGAEHAEQWPWLALALVPPAMSVLLGSGQTALAVRADYMRISNRLLYLQVMIQYLATLFLLPWFREMAFILGWVISSVFLSPVLANYMLREMGLGGSLFWEQLAKHAAVTAILCAVILLCRSFVGIDGLGRLIIVGGSSCLLAWALSAAIVLSQSDRAMFGRFARVMTPR
jgi:O-antigen/teichoic acid export membrane protein